MEKEIIKLELEKRETIDIFIRRGTDKNIIIDEIEKGIKDALTYFDSLE